jgi:hypothetical protein
MLSKIIKNQLGIQNVRYLTRQHSDQHSIFVSLQYNFKTNV